MEMIAYSRKGMQVNICLLSLQSQEMGCSDVTSGYPVFTRYSAVLRVVDGPPGFRASQLGIKA